MLCLVGSQSILAPPVKTVFKAPEHLIQAASGRFRARLEGCVLTIIWTPAARISPAVPGPQINCG